MTDLKSEAKYVTLALLLLLAAALIVGAVLATGSGAAAEEPSANNQTTETPGGHVANSSAYENATCVPGLVGDGTGCLDNDEVTPTP